MTLRKNITTIISAAFAACMLTACFSDDTTLGDRPLCEITIDETSVKPVYNIYKNETLTVTPVCSQINGNLPLTYTWEIGQEVYSHEPQLTFVGKELGSWQCRLIVENEDGKTFYPFKLNVNSPYEEGITILSCDPQGKPMLSFMQEPEEGQQAEFYDYDCFAITTRMSTWLPILPTLFRAAAVLS